MSRPVLTLTDDQGRVLVAALQDILARHPDGTGSSRLFVRDFVAAVHRATGRTYSPSVYRRWLNAYAPGRHPSNEVLASEKAQLVAALDQEARAGRELATGGAGADLAEVVQRAVRRAMARPAPTSPAGSGAVDQIALAQRDFLQARLTESEQVLQQTRGHAARLAADLQAAIASRDTMQAHLTAVEGESARHAHQATLLVHEVGEQRRYAMRAIDEVRGETRVWKERCAAVEAKLVESKQLLEVFRQAAYARGAAIPLALRNEEEKS